MEKEIGKLRKNDTTEIVMRIDDFGGKKGLTIREFVTSDRYTGFTKSGVRISPDDFLKFKEMIDSIDEDDLKGEAESKPTAKKLPKGQEKLTEKIKRNSDDEELPDY